MPSFEATEWRRFLPNPEVEDTLADASAHSGQSVLVTGAGGYIGSALVRTIARFNPRCIVLLDSCEQNLFETASLLESAAGEVPHYAILGSVEDGGLLDEVFRRFRPDSVYHAAAFKHVPLLESNPFAAVRNNSLGTYTLARAVLRHGASRTTLISTDKAVNPHSIMGASKRIAELAIVAMSSDHCRMNAVRLSNVIGSPGSVLPVFLQQINEARPLTVTHPEANRWFLQLGGAVGAILACGGADCEGRILLPQLGEPVNIAELAGFLIHSFNKVPSSNAVAFTGLRPGDKITEEMTSPDETIEGPEKGGVTRVRTCRLKLSEIEQHLEDLRQSVESRDLPGLIRNVCSLVPGYVPSGPIQ